jgi:hypothetical protein
MKAAGLAPPRSAAQPCTARMAGAVLQRPSGAAGTGEAARLAAVRITPGAGAGAPVAGQCAGKFVVEPAQDRMPVRPCLPAPRWLASGHEHRDRMVPLNLLRMPSLDPAVTLFDS